MPVCAAACQPVPDRSQRCNRRAGHSATAWTRQVALACIAATGRASAALAIGIKQGLWVLSDFSKQIASLQRTGCAGRPLGRTAVPSLPGCIVVFLAEVHPERKYEHLRLTPMAAKPVPSGITVLRGAWRQPLLATCLPDTRPTWRAGSRELFFATGLHLYRPGLRTMLPTARLAAAPSIANRANATLTPRCPLRSAASLHGRRCGRYSMRDTAARFPGRK